MKRRAFLASILGILFINKTWTMDILRADVPNGNKRIYPRSVLENYVKSFKTLLYGQFGMCEGGEKTHIVKRVFMDGEYLKAEIMTINSPEGEKVEKLLLSDKVAFRTLGEATTYEKDGYLVIGEDYKLLGINAVPINKATVL